MRPVEPPFEIVFLNTRVKVSEHELGERRVFHVELKAPLRPLVITVGLDKKQKKFWTSVPEGRQAEAEQVGKLIAQYIRNKN